MGYYAGALIAFVQLRIKSTALRLCNYELRIYTVTQRVYVCWSV